MFYSRHVCLVLKKNAWCQILSNLYRQLGFEFSCEGRDGTERTSSSARSLSGHKWGPARIVWLEPNYFFS